jgi:hypothetical protein
MALPYLRIIESYGQLTVVVRVLSDESYGGREALSRLLASGRRDIAEVSLEAVDRIIGKKGVEARVKLPWFLLWNRESLGSKAAQALGRLAEDQSGTVRAAGAAAARQLGVCTEETGPSWRASPGTRKVREGRAGEAGGEFWAGRRPGATP